MQNNSKRDKLIRQYKELLKKSREATDEKEKKRFSTLASEKHEEILMEEMGRDKNIKRFNQY